MQRIGVVRLIMTAKEIFAELGYEWEIHENKEGVQVIKYIKKNTPGFYIEFSLKDKKIYPNIYALSKGEIKAIIKQCQELGWLDE